MGAPYARRQLKPKLRAQNPKFKPARQFYLKTSLMALAKRQTREAALQRINPCCKAKDAQNCL